MNEENEVVMEVWRTVEQYDIDGNFIKTWISATEVERYIGIDQGAISACCKGKYGYKTAGGFIWRYAKNFD